MKKIWISFDTNISMDCIINLRNGSNHIICSSFKQIIVEDDGVKYVFVPRDLSSKPWICIDAEESTVQGIFAGSMCVGNNELSSYSYLKLIICILG